MARNFAYGFLVPLMIEVIRLAILNEKRQKVIEVAGGPLTISPQDWSERKTCTVSMHLGYGEKDIAVAKLGKAYETMAKDQGLGNMFGPQQRYAMWHDMAKLSGMNGFNTYLDPKAPPPQPDPLKVQEVQAKVTSANASMTQAQSAAQKDQRLAAMDQGKLDLQQRDQMVKALDHDRTHDRQDLETVARIHQGQEQLGIEHQLAANDAAKVRISASAPKV